MLQHFLRAILVAAVGKASISSPRVPIAIPTLRTTLRNVPRTGGIILSGDAYYVDILFPSCNVFSGCEYQGNLFAYESNSNYDGHQSLDWIKSHDLISFFDLSDPNGHNFQSKYGKKRRFKSLQVLICMSYSRLSLV